MFETAFLKLYSGASRIQRRFGILFRRHKASSPPQDPLSFSGSPTEIPQRPQEPSLFPSLPTEGLLRSQKLPPFCSLPTEILLLVGEALPLSSQVCLTMTCKMLSYVLGDGPGIALRGKAKQDDDRKQYLQLLSREHPSLLPCFLCMILHPRESLLESNPCSRFAGCSDFYPTKALFQYAHVQLATRAHNISPHHGLSLDKIPSPLEHWTVRGKEPRQSGIKTSSKLKIVNGRLLLKMEVEAKIDVLEEIEGCWRAQLTFESGRAIASRELLSVIRCQHGRFASVYYYQFLLGMMIKIYNLLQTAPGSKSHIVLDELRRCVYCATEVNFLIDVCKGASSTLTITCWKDLGSGMDSAERAWKSHCDVNVGNASEYHYMPDFNSSESIRESFEAPMSASRTTLKAHLAIELLPPHGTQAVDDGAVADLLRKHFRRLPN